MSAEATPMSVLQEEAFMASGRKCEPIVVPHMTIKTFDHEGSTSAGLENCSESSTRPSSPGGIGCSLLSCPLHDALTFFLTAGDLGRLSSSCNALRSELTVRSTDSNGEQGDERRLMVPVVELQVEDAEEVLERISLEHLHTVRIKKRLPFDALAAAAKKAGKQCLRSLEKLVIHGCILDAHDVKRHLAPLVTSTRKLTLLNMEKCRITDATVQQLCACGIVGRVETLNLRFNEITDKGALALAKSSDTMAMKWINLKMNRIGDQGAIALAQMVRHSTTMQMINLRRQVPGLTDRSAIAFAEALTVNTSLSKLRLRRNRITDKGVIAISQALGPRLKTLCLEAIPFDEVFFELDVEENRIGDEGVLESLRCISQVSKRARVELLFSGNNVTRETVSEALAATGENLDANDSRLCFDSKPEFDL